MQSFKPLSYQSTHFSEDQIPFYRLYVLIQSYSIVYVVMNEEGDVLIAKELMNTQGLGLEIFVQYILETEELFYKPFGIRKIIHSHPTFALLPKSFAEGKDSLHLARILIEDSLYEDDIEVEELTKLDASLVFPNSSFIESLCKEYFDLHQNGHVASASLRLANELKDDYPTHLLLHILEGKILISAHKDGKLILCNAFAYQSVIDALYFVQSVCKLYPKKPQELPIFMVGAFEKDSKLFRELLFHLPNCRIPTYIFQRYFSEEIKEMKSWKFGFMLLEMEAKA